MLLGTGERLSGCRRGASPPYEELGGFDHGVGRPPDAKYDEVLAWTLIELHDPPRPIALSAGQFARQAAAELLQHRLDRLRRDVQPRRCQSHSDHW